jgi:hypothetical protein
MQIKAIIKQTEEKIRIPQCGYLKGKSGTETFFTVKEVNINISVCFSYVMRKHISLKLQIWRIVESRKTLIISLRKLKLYVKL